MGLGAVLARVRRRRAARRRWREEALRLYGAAAAAARAPALYERYGIPDSFDGRFDALVLMLFLVLDRVERDPALGKEEADELRRLLLELAVADWDRALREAGVGDLGVGRHIKKMMTAALGRMTAYGAACAVDDAGMVDEAGLAAALARNVWRMEEDDGRARSLARRVIAIRRALADHPLPALTEELLAGGTVGEE